MFRNFFLVKYRGRLIIPLFIREKTITKKFLTYEIHIITIRNVM